MTVLIVEEDPSLAGLWKLHLERHNLKVDIAATSDAACSWLQEHIYKVVVLDLDLADGAALGIADMASYRNPATRIIFVTATTFFSDGSIFAISANAAGFMTVDTPPEDLAALVEHHLRE